MVATTKNTGAATLAEVSARPGSAMANESSAALPTVLPKGVRLLHRVFELCVVQILCDIVRFIAIAL